MAYYLILLSLIFSFSAQSQLIVKTYNIRNFSSEKSTNLPLLGRVLKSNAFDLLAVQEMRNPKLFQSFLKKALPKRDLKTIFSKCGGGGRQKLGFVYDSKKLHLKSYHEDLSLSGNRPSCNQGSRPAFMGFFKNLVDGSEFVAINLHLKAGGCSSCVQKRFAQLEKIQKIVQKLRKRNVSRILLMGDFNTTNYNNPQSPYKKSFDNFSKNLGFKDTGTQMKCTSYWSGRNRDDGIEVPSLLDHILISDDFFNSYQSAKTSLGAHCRSRSCKPSLLKDMGKVYTEVSDHCPVGLYLK